ncbi:MAG: hypothetical protein AAF696_14420 [Bacteroidota bacterium]
MDTSLTYSKRTSLQALTDYSLKLKIKSVFSEALIKYSLLFLLFGSGISFAVIFNIYLDISIYLALPLAVLTCIGLAIVFRLMINSYYHLKLSSFFLIYRICLLLLIGLLGVSLIALICIPLDLQLFEGEMGAKINKLNLIALESEFGGPYPPLLALIEEYNQISLASPLSKYVAIQYYFQLDHPQLYKSLSLMKVVLCIIACLPLLVLVLEPRRSVKNKIGQKPTKVLNKEASSPELPNSEIFDLEILHKHRKGELAPLFSQLLEKYMLENPALKQTWEGMDLFFKSEQIGRKELKESLDKDLLSQIFKNQESNNDAD